MNNLYNSVTSGIFIFTFFLAYTFFIDFRETQDEDLRMEENLKPIPDESTQDTHGTDTLSCFEPNPQPIKGAKRHSNRVINVGFAKCGSTSIFEAFGQMEGVEATHFLCTPGNQCCHCIQNAINRGDPPLKSCSNAHVFAQMECSDEQQCIFPQISYLDELYKENPSATLILPFRPMSDWIASVNRWRDFRDMMINVCEFPEYGFYKGMGKTDKELEDVFCNHVNHVRKFVKDHPTLYLVEFDIGADDVGEYLSRLIPGFEASFWGQYNANGPGDANPKSFLDNGDV